MNIGKFKLEGSGVNAGKESVPGFEGTPQFYLEPDNLYSLRGKFAFESLDFIVSKDMLFATKFHRILLKEWMNFLKVGGTACIIFRQGHGRSIPFLASEVFALFGNSVEFGWDLSGQDTIACLTKLQPSLPAHDSIDKWTFGIITGGKKDGDVDRIIDSILAQKIPHCEIIVCGTYANSGKRPIVYIPFGRKDEFGWITKKKNLIAAKAKYENMCIIHDRILFAEGWYDGMKKYGNYFDVLSCIQTLKGTDDRTGDWVTAGARYDPALSEYESFNGTMEYRDWDENIFIVGSLYILKKRVWALAPWNEHLLWNESEDIDVSSRYFLQGAVPRFNPHSRCIAISWKHGRMLSYEYNPKRLGNMRPMRVRFLKMVKGGMIRHAPPSIVDFFKCLEVNFPILLAIRQIILLRRITKMVTFDAQLGDLKAGVELALCNKARVRIESVGIYGGRVHWIALRGADGKVGTYSIKDCGNRFLAFSPD